MSPAAVALWYTLTMKFYDDTAITQTLSTLATEKRLKHLEKLVEEQTELLVAIGEFIKRTNDRPLD